MSLNRLFQNWGPVHYPPENLQILKAEIPERSNMLFFIVSFKIRIAPIGKHRPENS
jgi:hypothetical protein